MFTDIVDSTARAAINIATTNLNFMITDLEQERDITLSRGKGSATVDAREFEDFASGGGIPPHG